MRQTKKLINSITELNQTLASNNKLRERDLKMQEKIFRKQIRMEIIQEQMIRKLSRIDRT